MSKKIAIICIAFAMSGAGILIYHLYKSDLKVTAILAISQEPRNWVNRFSLWRIKSLHNCPHQRTFSPTTPNILILTEMNAGTADVNYANELFEHFINIGCSLEDRGSNGLAAIHIAILFRNPSLLKLVLDKGGKLETKILDYPALDGKSAKQYLAHICGKDDKNCAEMSDVIKEFE